MRETKVSLHIIYHDMSVSRPCILEVRVLIYAIPVWGAADNIYIKHLPILQKRIVRLLTFNDNYPVPAGPLVHTSTLFYELKILMIHEVFIVQTAKFVYKCLHNLNPPHLNIICRPSIGLLSCFYFYGFYSRRKMRMVWH